MSGPDDSFASHAAANTFMPATPNGPYTRNTEVAVAECGAAPPSSTPTIRLAQGPAAPQGYRDAVAMEQFAAHATVTLSCRNSVSPGGFTRSPWPRVRRTRQADQSVLVDLLRAGSGVALVASLTLR